MSILTQINEALNMFNKWDSSYSESEPKAHPNQDALNMNPQQVYYDEGRPVTHSGQTVGEYGGTEDPRYDQYKQPVTHSGKNVLQESVDMDALRRKGGSFGRLVSEAMTSYYEEDNS